MDVFSGDLCVGDPDSSGCPALASLRSVLNKGSVILWTADKDLRLMSMIGGVSRSAMPYPSHWNGKPIEDFFLAWGPNQAALHAHRSALTGQSCDFEAIVNGQDLTAHVDPFRGSDGEVLGVIGIAQASTEQLVAEKARRLSEQNCRSLIEEAPYSICRVTKSGQMLQVNPAMLEMLRYGATEEADLLLRDLPLIFTNPEAFTALQGELLKNGTVQGVEAAWLCSDGQQIQVRLGGRAVSNALGDLVYFHIVAEDVTERKRLETHLGQSEKMRAIGQLAGGVAHDFNNLLTVIAGQIEVVLGRAVDNDVRSRLEDAQEAAKRAAALTRQLLAFSRRQVLQSKPLNLNALLENLSQMLRRLIREDIAVTFIPGRDLGLVSVDPNQIEQVLINLAVNAQDAMPKGGQLTIHTGRLLVTEEASQPSAVMEPGEYVVTTVRDTGVGMDLNTQARIFEPFFTTKRTGEGTGLGLSMAYGVVRQSGGYIQVESQLGQGSTFKIYLKRVDGVEAKREDAAQPPSQGGCETVLLAEDEESVRNLMADHLRSLGYEVLTAYDGMSAIEIARAYTGRIDLLISDLVMPKMGGQELAEILLKELALMKVIFVSGYAGHSAAGNDLFPDGYFLPKPFSMQQVANMVREVLDGSAQEIATEPNRAPERFS